MLKAMTLTRHGASLRLSARALAAVLGIAVLAGCGLIGRQGGPQDPRDAVQGSTQARERQWARTAWRYVENNTDGERGLVNGMDRSPTVTVSNMADALAATIAARELGIIEAREFDLRMSRLLGFLGSMDLSEGRLPNKAYHAGTGKMINFEGRPADIGWSAVDIGRLLLWLKIAGQRHSQFQEYADKAVVRWNFCEVIDNCGVLRGSGRAAGGQSFRYQEGRLGYEQLAGAGYAAWGFQARASAELPATEAVNIYGLPVRYDARDARATGVPTPVLTMPFVLMGMELGWDRPGTREMADQVFRIQEERWKRERQVTARTDWQSREAPYVVLDSVFAAGYPWNTLGADGKEYDKLALVSTRAAFGMWALRPGEYADRLIETVQHLYDPDRGWFEGRLEASGAPQTNLTLATNAAVLEALLYKAKGRLYAREDRPGYFQAQTADPFLRLNRCLPNERAACEAAPAAAAAPVAPPGR
jgi:hypothetical protein